VSTLTLADNAKWVDDLLHDFPDLGTTAWRVTVIAGLVSIEVTGGYDEANLWRSVVGGRMDPAQTNAAGVRRQHITGRHVTVELVSQTGATRTGLPVVES
jgi:hypothetical protein